MNVNILNFYMFYVQEKKELKSSLLFGVTLKGVCIYQVGLP